MLNEIELRPGDGVYINGTKVHAITDVNIKASVDDLTEVTFKVYGEVKGIDDLNPGYTFGRKEGD